MAGSGLTTIERRIAAARKAAATRQQMRIASGRVTCCSGCDGSLDAKGWYCRACRAAYMRGYRKSSRETSVAEAHQ